MEQQQGQMTDKEKDKAKAQEPQQATHIDKGLSVVERVIGFNKKYGIGSVIKALCVLFFASYIIFFSFNPQYLIDKFERMGEKKHSEFVQQRIYTDEELRIILGDLLTDSGADRAWIIEFHNGGRNLSSELPFLFGSLRLEEVESGIMHIDEEYADFPLSKYKISYDILRNGYYYSDVDSVRHIDERLFYKLKSAGTSYVAAMVLYNGENPLGILGVSYCHGKTPDLRQLGTEIRRRATQVSVLLGSAQIPMKP